MKRRREEKRGQMILPMFFCFVAGAAAGWWLHARARQTAEPVVVQEIHGHDETLPTIGATNVAPPVVHADEPRLSDDLIADLRQRRLRPPLEGSDVRLFKGQFGQRRGGGARGHEAVDLPAPRNTPIVAVDSGTIAKLFVSQLGGNTVYQFDEDRRVCYYYAHLERYADALREGQSVRAGEVIGYVGTSGNAPSNSPHLHFAVFALTADKQWWRGTALDPFLIYGPAS